MKRPPLIVNRHTALTDHDRDMIGLRSVVARAPGKINVSLEVGPPREDGYHSVATIYLAVNLFEDIRASERMDTEFTISLSPDSAPFADPETFPIGPENLVIRAAAELRAYTGVKAGADLEVTKRVPIAGGMGGGSADAAAALVACNALWETGLNREELAIVGARLGADVPFALYGGAAVGLGVGISSHPCCCGTRLTGSWCRPATGSAPPRSMERWTSCAPNRTWKRPRMWTLTPCTHW